MPPPLPGEDEGEWKPECLERRSKSSKEPSWSPAKTVEDWVSGTSRGSVGASTEEGDTEAEEGEEEEEGPFFKGEEAAVDVLEDAGERWVDRDDGEGQRVWSCHCHCQDGSGRRRRRLGKASRWARGVVIWYL